MTETKEAIVFDGSVSTFHQLGNGANEEEVRPPADHVPYRRAPQDHSSLEQQEDISLPSTGASSGDGNKVLPPFLYDTHHHPCYTDAAVPPVALLLLGNAGAGKSTLLTQLGGTKFGSGAKFRQGFTKDVSEQDVDIAGQSVRLIDVPGLFEPSDKETQFNATQLTKALRHQNYNYRLYFVLKADNRGPGDNEMVMMSKISECVRKADGSKMSFGVIVNQIRTADVHSMYEQEMVSDRFQSVFAGLDIPGFTFDIKIDSVIMLPYDEVGLMHGRFRGIIAQEILKHQASAITLEKDISFCNNDLKRYHAGILGAASRAIATPLAHSGPSMHGGSSQAFPSQSSTKPKTDILTGFIKVVAEPDKKIMKLWQKAAQAAVIKNLHRPAK
ncbi:hypothetical protein BGZ82_011190 [Podila clonocystis]|nr:hypothetical protein BGZ82_011190 [Podila clonocystis]